MKLLTPQIIAMIGGLVLIVGGIAIHVLRAPAPGMDDVQLLTLRFYTDHPGLAFAGLGVILQIVGLVGTAIWAGRNSN